MVLHQRSQKMEPFMLVVGDKEIATSTVSVRLRTGEQLASQSFDGFKKAVTGTIRDRVKGLKI